MENQDPQPPKDFAARFKKPGETDAQAAAREKAEDVAAAQAAEAAARPYTFTGLLEETLTAPVRPWAAFASAAARPEPSFGLLVANAAVFGCAFLAMNLLHAAIVFPPSLMAHGAPQIVVMGGLSLLFLLFCGAFAAAVVHAVAHVAGGSGSFTRSYQAVSMLGAMLPVQAASMWAPALAFIPPLYGGLVAAAAVEQLHRAKPAVARGIFCGVAAFFVFSAYVVKTQLDRIVAPYMAAQKAMQQMAELPQPALPAPQPLDPNAPAPQAAQPGAQPPAAPGQSSLDLISGPQGAALSQIGPGGPTPEQVQQVTQAGSNMLSSIVPLLNNPAMQKNMSPAQREEVQQLLKTIEHMQENLRTGKKMDRAESEKLMREMQSLAQKAMANAAQAKPKTSKKNEEK